MTPFCLQSPEWLLSQVIHSYFGMSMGAALVAWCLSYYLENLFSIIGRATQELEGGYVVLLAVSYDESSKVPMSQYARRGLHRFLCL